MKFRKPKIEPMEMNLTPMIDCLLFLVVFLLLSTTFNQHSRLNLVLPEATGVPESKHPKKVDIAVNTEGQYHVNGQALQGDGEAELTAALRQAAAGDTSLPLVIAADGKASHQSVVRIMDVAGKLGFVNINISTRVPIGERP
ncbi:MAG: biopolymer transporter ExbD [Pseudomonadota bacterium]|nr:biopolymer transporter ExbD [Pseudomonadota bacterium]